MPYIQRDGAGNINGLFANEQSYASEFLADDDAAVVAFLTPPEKSDDIETLKQEAQALLDRISAIEARNG